MSHPDRYAVAPSAAARHRKTRQRPDDENIVGLRPPASIGLTWSYVIIGTDLGASPL